MALWPPSGERVGSDVSVLSRFSELELLQGCKNLREWGLLEDYLSTQIYLEASKGTWREAARIYFDLRRKGITVGSPVDCCIAQIALESGALLLHCDQDLECAVFGKADRIVAGDKEMLRLKEFRYRLAVIVEKDKEDQASNESTISSCLSKGLDAGRLGGGPQPEDRILVGTS